MHAAYNNPGTLIRRERAYVCWHQSINQESGETSDDCNDKSNNKWNSPLEIATWCTGSLARFIGKFTVNHVYNCHFFLSFLSSFFILFIIL